MDYAVATTDPLLVDDFVRDAYIYDIYDGDTVYYHANLGYSTWAAFQTGRLLDVWAPEIRPLATRAQGTASLNYLQGLVEKYALNRHRPEDCKHLGYHIRIKSLEAPNKWFRNVPLPDKGKYGRWLVRLYGLDDKGKLVDINKLMVDAGMATATP